MIVRDKFIIRAVGFKDLDTLYWMNNESGRGAYQEYAFESRDVISENLRSGKLFNDGFQMLIAETPDKEYLGAVYLNFPRTGLVRYGLVLDSDTRGQGYGRLITEAVIEYIFSNFPVVRLEAETDKENAPARKVLEESGFQEEGVLRNYRFHHGSYRDFVIYSKVRQNHKNQKIKKGA
ncbi:MAG: GNAT family N-acetyltransferase [Clostridiales bacterium]|nr:GNAT family N-acetyltransferase [Clostridiales bacterium]